MTNYVGTTLNALPPVLALNGSELCFIYQFDALLGEYITFSCTTRQIASLASGTSPGVQICSMRQLFAALAADDVMLTAFEQLSSDITDSFNIAWNHAYQMTITDPFIVNFLQPAIGFTDGQMVTLFALAQTFPV